MGFADRLRAWLRGDEASSGGSLPKRTSSGRAEDGGPDFSAGTASGRRAGHLKGRGRGRAQHPSGSFDPSSMLEFARSRSGVEMYLEPRTRLYGASVLLVADDGEYLRRPVPDADTVRRFCREHGIPVYDAARTGYPRRVRDYDRGVRPDRVELEDLPPWPGSEQDEEEPPPPPPSA